MQSFKHATKRHNQLSLWLVIENTWRAARVVCFCTTQRRRPLGALHVAKTPAQEACRAWRKEYSGEAPSTPMHCEKCGGSHVIFLEPMDNVAYLFTTAAAKFGQIERTNF